MLRSIRSAKVDRNLSLTTSRVRYSFTRGKKRQQNISVSFYCLTLAEVARDMATRLYAYPLHRRCCKRAKTVNTDPQYRNDLKRRKHLR